MWLPVLDIMCNESGTAFAQGAPLPTTFASSLGNGVYPGPLWTPTATGSGDAGSSDEPHGLRGPQGRDDPRAGLDMRMPSSRTWLGHLLHARRRRRTYCVTTNDIFSSPYGGLPETPMGTQWQPTIDQIIADAIHTRSRISPSNGIIKFAGAPITWNGGLEPRPPRPEHALDAERNPRRFSIGCSARELRPRRRAADDADAYRYLHKLRRSVLDAVLADANRLKLGLGSADGKRIDAHMDSIRSLEMRIPRRRGHDAGTGGTGTCKNPAAPTEMDASLDLMKVTATSQAMNKLVAAGARLQHDARLLSSVVWRTRRQPYPIIQQDFEHHELTHSGPTQNQQAARSISTS